MLSRRCALLALCPALGCASAAPAAAPPPRGAPGRCAAGQPEMRPDAPLDPLNSFGPAGGRANPELHPTRGFFALNRPPTSPREGEGYPIELRLSAEPLVSPGAPLGLELSFVNRSRAALTLLHPLDGSGEHARPLHYDLYARPEGSFQSYRFGRLGARCAEVNAIGARDYFELPPGGAAEARTEEWVEFHRARLLSPGRYVLWAVYRFCGFDPAEAAADREGRDLRRPDALRGEYASNPVTVEVR